MTTGNIVLIVYIAGVIVCFMYLYRLMKKEGEDVTSGNLFYMGLVSLFSWVGVLGCFVGWKFKKLDEAYRTMVEESDIANKENSLDIGKEWKDSEHDDYFPMSGIA